MRLIRSEFMKIRTTNVWWLFGIGVIVCTGIALALWLSIGYQDIQNAQGSGEAFVPPPPDANVPPQQVEQMRRQWEYSQDITRVLHNTASQAYTSGQYFGVMFAMLLGAIMFTNEFFHQTATPTFLTTPRRIKVILAKFAAAALAALFFWAVTTVINLIAGGILFRSQGYGTQLDQWPVQRAILMNAVAFGLWGVLGVGLGVLIRNQIGAVVTGAIAYIIGTQAVTLVFGLLAGLLEQTWISKVAVIWPSVASQVMVSSEPMFGLTAQWWVGALVLVGYGLVFGAVGTLITHRRDIS